MGRNKAMLVVDGKTLLERSVEVLLPLVDPVIVVADEEGRYPVSGFRVVADAFPGAGPVGGIVTAISALGVGAHLVVACDMPFLQADLIRLLLDAATDEFDAVVPWIADRPEPLCAIYRDSCLAPLRTFLAAGERAAHRALQTLRTRRIEERQLRTVDPQLLSFVNINTPEEAARWLAYPDSCAPKQARDGDQ